jgi:ketosteroid isomerase-like protein
MAGENVQLVQRWFDGLARGELSPELCDPDVLIRNWDEAPVRGPYHGHDGLRHWWEDFAEAFEDVRMELTEIVEVDEQRVVTVPRIVGRFRLTGIDLDAKFGSIVTVRDRKILSAIGYSSPGRAKKAAGLRRPNPEERG